MTIPSSETEATAKEEKIQKAFEILLAISSVQREEARKELTAKYEEMERSGEIYSINCEIIFPPQVKAKYGIGGAIVDIRTVLHPIADILQTEDHQRAFVLREIAEEFYGEDDEDDEDFVLLDDVAEKLDLLVSELYANAEENMSPPESGQ